jgi:hypothetical protein
MLPALEKQSIEEQMPFRAIFWIRSDGFPSNFAVFQKFESDGASNLCCRFDYSVYQVCCRLSFLGIRKPPGKCMKQMGLEGHRVRLDQTTAGTSNPLR